MLGNPEKLHKLFPLQDQLMPYATARPGIEIVGKARGSSGIVLVALAAALSVFLLNGVGLFYYDTGGYLAAGDRVLTALGAARQPDEIARVPEPQAGASPSAEPMQSITTEAPAPEVNAGSSHPVTPGSEIGVKTGSEPTAPETGPNVTIGSRSAAYGVALALALRSGWLDGMVLVNLAALWLALWLVARTLRPFASGHAALRLSAFMVLAGCAGSLPFYVAFLMPDIFAPILILVMALVASHGQDMRWWEMGLALLLAVLAVLFHPSHLVMAALLLPLGIILSPTRLRMRLMLAALLGLIVVGLGVGERIAFSRAVSKVQGGVVLYLPFLTARLIDDGPGRAFLAGVCPDPARATCKLMENLTRAGDFPERFDAPVILFDRTPDYGSYRLLSETDQRLIAAEQVSFALEVAATQPLGIAAAVAGNVLHQLSLSRIDMTLATPDIVARLVAPGGGLDPSYADGRLGHLSAFWRDLLWAGQAAVYLASALWLTVGLLRRGGPLAGEKRLVAMILLGILVNALVCGAISEPADRYGARVMFLLPLTCLMRNTKWRGKSVSGGLF